LPVRALELRGAAHLDGLTEGPETWLTRRLAADVAAETWLAVPAIDGCTYSRYEASDTGSPVRSLGGTGRNGRVLTAGPVSTRPHQGNYVKLDMRCDNLAHKRSHTFLMQEVVLTTFDRPRPRGMQGSHLSGNPQWNWIEWLIWEDQPANERRKTDRPPPPEPTHPCKNAPACPGKALNPGRRCLSCVDEVRHQSAAMLDDGMLLPAVARHFGNSESWIWQLAQAGGYTGTLEQAKGLHKPLTGWRKTAARLLGVS
jgi:hypothetical protein